MLLKLILVFCIIQNASPIPYKLNKEFQFGHSDRNGIDLHHKINPNKSHFKEDPSDLSSESRRVFDWIKYMLNKNVTKGTTQKPTYEESLEERIKFRQIEKNLTDTLTKLSHVLNQILNIVKYARYTHFDDIDAFLPTKLRSNKVNRREKRYRKSLYKRNIIPTEIGHENTNNRGQNNVSDNVKDHLKKDIKMILDESGNIVHNNKENKNIKTEKNTKNSEPSINSKENIIKTAGNHSNDVATAKIDTKTYVPVKIGSSHLNIQETRAKRETKEMKKVVPKNLEVNKNIEVENKNSSAKHEVNTTSEAEDINITKINRRRAMIPIKVTNDEVKNRLFQYIDEAFSEIFKRIDSLKQTKQMYAKDVSYQVGYIVSSIDTLAVNIGNMKRDMDKNMFIWDDKKILNLYDTIKVSNQAVADLLEILKIYIQKSIAGQGGGV